MKNVKENDSTQVEVYPSYLGALYNAMPDKFEDRKNVFKPWLYRVVAVACILLAVFPEWLPVAAPWLIRTVGIIAALMGLIASWMAGTSTYNKQSGGKIRTVNTKKFIREETEVEAIVAAFKQHDFRYLTELPSGNNQPVQLHVDEDPVGREFYCLLTTYLPGSKIIGLAEPVILSGREYDENEDYFRHMCDHDAD